jgi:hypothetical protein
MTVFWDIAPCNLVEVAEISEKRTALIIRAIAPMMAAVRTSETSVYFNQSTRRNVPEDCLSSSLYLASRSALICFHAEFKCSNPFLIVCLTVTPYIFGKALCICERVAKRSSFWQTILLSRWWPLFLCEVPCSYNGKAHLIMVNTNNEY